MGPNVQAQRVAPTAPRARLAPSLSTTQLVLLATVCVLGAALATIAVTILGALAREDGFENLDQERQRYSLLNEAHVSGLTGGLVILSYAVSGDQALLSDFKESQSDLQRSLRALSNFGQLPPDQQATIDSLNETNVVLASYYQRLVAAAEARDTAAALEIMESPDLQQAARVFLADLDRATAQAQERLSGVRNDDRSSQLHWDWAIMGLTAFLVVILVVSAFLITRSVVLPIGALAEVTRAIAHGDLTARAKPGGPKDVNGLAQDVNAMTDALIARTEQLSDYLSRDLERRTVELEETNRRLAEAEARTRAIISNAIDAVITIDGAGAITEWNAQAEAIFGWPKHEIIGSQIDETILPERYRAAHRNALEHHLATGEGRFLNRRIEIVALRRDGTEFPIELAISPLQQRGSISFSAFARDITERKEAEARLREQTSRDPLTGVLNHGAIVERLRNAIGPEPDVNLRAIIMADVDGLKATNDVHGHLVGDQVLVQAARTLTDHGAIVGRYGGDEFVVLLTDTYPGTPTAYTDAALARLAAVEIRDPATSAQVRVSISLGIALFPEEASAAQSLLEISDSAMYAMKRQRPGPVGNAPTLGNDGAAELVGQMVPLLTAPGTADEKLQLVSKRLSDIAGYDAVNVTMFADVPAVSQGPRAANTFAKAPQELVQAWNEEQRQGSDEVHPVRALLQKAKRPLIFDDPWHDERFTQQQRDILQAAELKSVLVAPFIWKDDVIGFIGVASKNERAFGPFEGQFLASVATHVTAIVQMATLVTELEVSQTDLRSAREETVLLLAASAEAHDSTTGRHLSNVRRLAELLAAFLGFDEEETREIGLATTLHDIGKINVPESILAKSGALSPSEWEEMRKHTVRGHEFLAGRSGFELAAAVARSHHERWDGSGYPEGLSGDQIPIGAAIASVADAFDAMTSARPYKAARSAQEARDEIAAAAGRQFSPQVVEAFLHLYNRGAVQQTLAPDHQHLAAA